MVITIDGPAAAGKSTVARALAQRVGFEYVDTGALYRAATWKAIQEGIDLKDPAALAQVVRAARIEFVQRGEERRVICDGQDVTAEIRSPEVTERVRYVADELAARRALIELQRRFGRGRNLVTEGRDQGTEVWPDAELKVYLDASPEVRAARRLKDLRELGAPLTLEEVRADIDRRDRLDRSRPVGRLQCTEDMLVVDSTHLSVDQVVARLEAEADRRRSTKVQGTPARPEGRP